jgi:uncharacterized RDD family membrane protein YckC
MKNIVEIEIAGNEYEASGIIRNNLAGLLDALLYCLLVYLIWKRMIQLPKNFFNPVNGIQIFGILPAYLIYRIVNVLFMSATIGMRIAGIKLMRADGKELSIIERILAGCMVYINDIYPYKRSRLRS